MGSKMFGTVIDSSHNPIHWLDRAKEYLDAGEESMAREVVVGHRNLPTRDSRIHRGWGEICHALGMAGQARESYGRALKENPGDGETLYRLALLFSETGHYEKAIELLRRALKHAPEHQEARTLLSETYHELGLCGQAEALSPERDNARPPSPLRFFPPSVSLRDTATCLRLFSGLEVGYAEQQVSPRDGRVVFERQDAALDHDSIAAHILGNRTLAVYPLRTDKTVRFAAVLIRLPAGLLEENRKNRGYLTLLEEKMKHHALLLARFAFELGFPAYPESTGDLQFRVFFYFETFVHLLKAKGFVSTFLQMAPEPESPILAEPLLATRPAGIGWLEQGILLPLGVHRGTLKRSLFLSMDDGEPHGEQLKYLRKMRPLSVDRAIRALRSIGHKDPVTTPAQRIASATIKALRQQCPVLNELIRRSLSGKVLRHEEKLVLFYTVGLLDREGRDLHDLLAACPDYDFEKVSRQAARLKSHPMSCLKMRELIPEITASVPCHCMFDLRGGKYPSPLLHVSPHLVPAAEVFPIPEDLSLKEAARRYSKLLLHRDEIERAMGKLGALIEVRAQRAGVESVKLDAGMLRRIEEDGRVRWTLEVV